MVDKVWNRGAGMIGGQWSHVSFMFQGWDGRGRYASEVGGGHHHQHHYVR